MGKLSYQVLDANRVAGCLRRGYSRPWPKIVNLGSELGDASAAKAVAGVCHEPPGVIFFATRFATGSLRQVAWACLQIHGISLQAFGPRTRNELQVAGLAIRTTNHSMPSNG